MALGELVAIVHWNGVLTQYYWDNTMELKPRTNLMFDVDSERSLIASRVILKINQDLAFSNLKAAPKFAPSFTSKCWSHWLYQSSRRSLNGLSIKRKHSICFFEISQREESSRRIYWKLSNARPDLPLDVMAFCSTKFIATFNWTTKDDHNRR